MSETQANLDYASVSNEAPADRLLRRAVAWFAIVEGGASIAGMALHVALARGWIAKPASTSWSFLRWEIGAAAGQMLAMSALLVGGLLLLRRSPASIIVLRAAVAGWIVMSLASQVMMLAFNPAFASYYATPATATAYALQFVAGIATPVFLGLVTLPPLARRMA